MKQSASGVEKLSFTTGPHYLGPQPDREWGAFLGNGRQ